ncbi:MAG: hypothetical protein D6710_00175 [Nitrospirae bacterium]|nr:MAG: hypothetical protein D6710_00175 [Nitrospirota bacterium]
MKKLSALLLMVMLSALTTNAIAGTTTDPGIKKRMRHQEQRIKQGIRTGSLTWTEALRLERELSMIRCEERRFKSDGVLTKKERKKLHHDLNRSSRHIFREKHDRQKRR